MELLISRVLRAMAEDATFPCVREAEVRRAGAVSLRDVSRAELVRDAEARAASLAAAGVEPGDRVALCLPSSAGFASWFLGAIGAGAIPVPLPSLGALGTKSVFRERIAGVVADCAPKVIVVDAATSRALDDLGTPIVRGDEAAGAARRALVQPAADAAAFIQYTSGSTGRPKGIVVTHANLAANLIAMGAALEVTPDDVSVTWLPIYHDMGLIGGLLAALYSGFTTVLMSAVAFMTEPASWLRVISAVRGTLSVAPSFAYARCVEKVTAEQLAGLDLSRWRLALNGAEPIDAEAARAFVELLAQAGLRETAMYPVYGLAEATLAVAFPRPGSALRIDRVSRRALSEHGEARAGDDGAFVCVGRPVPLHSVEIRDPSSGAVLGERRVGEIVVRGPSVTPCEYVLGAPLPAPRAELHTGDLGYLADGELFVVDRLKDVIIVAGRNYSPVDLERAASTVEGVRPDRAVAFGVADPVQGTEQVILCAEVAGGDPTRDAAVAEAVRRVVAERCGVWPARVLMVRRGTIPRTSSGKLQRRRAREMYLAGTLLPRDARLAA